VNHDRERNQRLILAARKEGGEAGEAGEAGEYDSAGEDGEAGEAGEGEGGEYGESPCKRASIHTWSGSVLLVKGKACASALRTKLAFVG
jgi:hypothetical protein